MSSWENKVDYDERFADLASSLDEVLPTFMKLPMAKANS